MNRSERLLLMFFDEEGRRINTYLKTNQDISTEEDIREQTIPSENDNKLNCRKTMLKQAIHSEIDEQAQSVAKEEENSHKNERKLSFRRLMRGQKYKGYSGEGGRFK
ncbi:hypothetical protein HHI36_007670 [Cryptolaemus montrouzieri]|uniref:Uncharacterized protein n=1 Tax=Cryptolaemus montrouzieri TaxID=559131 RepID=A0ABD2MQE9_9CUCU